MRSFIAFRDETGDEPSRTLFRVGSASSPELLNVTTMRIVPVAAGLIVVGVIAALPFRRIEPVRNTLVPIGAATGPIRVQGEDESISGVVQWPDRPGFDPSIAWQPQPMKWNTSSPSFEMPDMPPTFPRQSLDVPIPAPLRDRFPAGVFSAAPTLEVTPVQALPTQISLDDRFVYHPPETSRLSPAVKIQPASAHRADPIDQSPSTRQYIREPM